MSSTMSTPKSKIQELINALHSANSRITSAEQENRETRAKISELYRMGVSMRNSLAAGTTSSESDQFPQMRTEDLSEMRPVQLINLLGSLYATVGKNLNSVRADYRELTAGLEGADAALDEWNNLRVGGNSLAAANGFRDFTAPAIGSARNATPPPELAPAATRSIPVDTPKVSASTSGDTSKQPDSTQKQTPVSPTPQKPASRPTAPTSATKSRK